MKRLVLVGDFGANVDEGMRKICNRLLQDLLASFEILPVDTKEFCTLRALPRVVAFRPDIVHYLNGPRVYSLLALKAYFWALPASVRIVASGSRPYLGRVARLCLRLYAPHVFFAQARRWQRLFAAAGAATYDLPNGVDLQKFCRVSAEERRSLRMALGLPLDKRLVLHVGHIKANRNLDCLVEIQRSSEFQVVVIGSRSQSQNGPFRDELEDAGVLIRTDYLPHIEQVYQAADLYVFTVKPTPLAGFPQAYHEVGVIDFPLSVLEAMACGLPTVSTRHDALLHFLGESAGLRYFDGTGVDCLEAVRDLSAAQESPREAVRRFDHKLVIEELRRLYALMDKETAVCV